MKENRDKVLGWVLAHEGGYAERDTEPGGAVNMGISFDTYKRFWKLRAPLAAAPTFADLRAMTKAQAEEIYTSLYFVPIKFDFMPSGVDYCLVDWAINSGPAGAIRALQKRMGFPVTGKIGPQFSWALRKRVGMVDVICNARLDFNSTLKNAEKPIKPGSKRTWKTVWAERIEAVRKRAKELEQNAP